MVDFALAYAARDIPVFPLKPRGKEPIIPTPEGQEGTGGFHLASREQAQIQQWWQKYRHANVGMPAGHASGYVVFDEDPRNGFERDRIIRDFGPLPPTLTAETGGGGRHLFYRYPKSHSGDLPGRKFTESHGFEIKSDEGYIVAPPSIHPSGRPYQWANDLEPAPLPAWMLDLLMRKDVPSAIESETLRRPVVLRRKDEDAGVFWLRRAVEMVSAGTSDDVAYWLAVQLLCDPNVHDPAAILTEYGHAASFDPHRPFTERDVARWLRSARASRIVQKGEPARVKTTATNVTPIRQPVDAHPITDGTAALQTPPTEAGQQERYALTEMGNAERLHAAHGQDIRYCKAFGFCVWDGTRWRPDAELMLRGWAKETVRAMYADAAELAKRASNAEHSEQSKQLAAESVDLMKWARKSETAHMIDAMLNLIRDTCQIDAVAFDAKPMLFNVRNGTLDLTTGQLLPHRRDDYLMQISPVAYDTKAQAPTFERFVRQIMCDRTDLVRYLQRALGYCLTGDVKEQVWHLLVGEGENGKSTLIEAICAVMGEYADMLEPESIIIGGKATDPNAPSPAIASLKGKRLVKVSETEEGARIAPARIKRLSGADELSGRHLNKGIFKFMPTFKLFIYTNHRPQVRETTHAFWRRVRYIPFDFNLGKLPPEAKDLDLPKKLRAEASGILAWLVAGCLAWQREGLKPPKEILEATEAYKVASDLLKTFLDETVLEAFQGSVSARAIYGRYTTWCEDYGERPMSQRRLGETLAERGFQREHTRSGWVWMNIRLTDRE